jgi:hypothetical protein
MGTVLIVLMWQAILLASLWLGFGFFLTSMIAWRERGYLKKNPWRGVRRFPLGVVVTPWIAFKHGLRETL